MRFSEDKNTYHLEDFSLLPGCFCLAFCSVVEICSIFFRKGLGRVTLNVLFRTECLKNGLSYEDPNKRTAYFNHITHKL